MEVLQEGIPIVDHGDIQLNHNGAGDDEYYDEEDEGGEVPL